jgi:hypothetical protein
MLQKIACLGFLGLAAVGVSCGADPAEPTSGLERLERKNPTLNAQNNPSHGCQVDTTGGVPHQNGYALVMGAVCQTFWDPGQCFPGQLCAGVKASCSGNYYYNPNDTW